MTQAASADAPVAVGAAPEPAWRVRDARLIVSAERITNIGVWASSYKVNDSETSTSTGQEVNLLMTGENAMPTLGFDYAHVFTVGGVLGVRSRASSSKPSGSTSSSFDGPTYLSYLVGIRGGVILGSGEKFAFWLRGGIYHQGWSVDYPDTETPGSANSSSETFVLMDPQFVFAPVAHAGISFGPYLQLGGGRNEDGGSETGSYTSVALGVSANVLALF